LSRTSYGHNKDQTIKRYVLASHLILGKELCSEAVRPFFLERGAKAKRSKLGRVPAVSIILRIFQDAGQGHKRYKSRCEREK